MPILLPEVTKLLLLKWLLTIGGIYVIRLFFRQSFRITGLAPIITVAVVIAPVNVFLREIAELCGLPQTFGVLLVFSIILNAVIIYSASYVVSQFYVENFIVALTIAVFLSGFTLLLSHLIKTPVFPEGIFSATRVLSSTEVVATTLRFIFPL